MKPLSNRKRKIAKKSFAKQAQPWHKFSSQDYAALPKE